MKYTQIYDRIADTYFTSHKERLKQKSLARKNKSFFFVSIGLAIFLFLVFVLIFVLFINTHPGLRAQKKSLSVLGNILPLRLDYNFSNSSEKIKSISLDLPKVNLADYDTLEFALRGDSAKGFSRQVRIEFLSSRKEKKAIYIEGINSGWKTFKVPLHQVPILDTFSDLSNISFVIEGWNTDKEKGRIFIDKIKFTKLDKKS
jgi:hypothetical protein